MTLATRVLSASDAAAYREIRLTALQETPRVFASSYDEEARLPLATFAEWLTVDTIFAAFSDNELCGTFSLEWSGIQRSSHIGHLKNLYVCSWARGSGVGDALINAAVERTVGRLAQLETAVLTTNRAACRLFDRNMFSVYGIQPNGLRIDGQFFDRQLRIRFLGDVAPRSVFSRCPDRSTGDQRSSQTKTGEGNYP